MFVPEKKKGVVYEVPCQDCGEVYVGETGRTLKKRISEHKQAVKKGDRKNGIAVHVMDKSHTINWEEANVRTSETGYWRRRVQEAIRIQRQPNTMNLDCGMILGNVWTPALRLCYNYNFYLFIYLSIYLFIYLSTYLFIWIPALRLCNNYNFYLFIRHARACVLIFIQPI